MEVHSVESNISQKEREKMVKRRSERTSTVNRIVAPRTVFQMAIMFFQFERKSAHDGNKHQEGLLGE